MSNVKYGSINLCESAAGVFKRDYLDWSKFCYFTLQNIWLPIRYAFQKLQNCSKSLDQKKSLEKLLFKSLGPEN